MTVSQSNVSLVHLTDKEDLAVPSSSRQIRENEHQGSVSVE